MPDCDPVGRLIVSLHVATIRRLPASRHDTDVRLPLEDRKKCYAAAQAIDGIGTAAVHR